MSTRSIVPPFALFGYPYDGLTPLEEPVEDQLLQSREPGMALVWRLHADPGTRDPLDIARGRPPGMALIAVLPPSEQIRSAIDVLTVVDRCKPHSVLPFHPEPEPEDLARVLQRPPEALSVEVSDYLTWRGIRVDGDTRRIIRRTLDLSAELRTVSALARALYISRRALGRRFLSRNLPSPSHWLQFGRALRAAIQLQTTPDSLFTVAADLGYPDGFALSNQMKRLTGVRPSVARACLGWEWFVEAWLEEERRAGHFRQTPVGADQVLQRVTEPATSHAAKPPSATAPGRRRVAVGRRGT